LPNIRYQAACLPACPLSARTAKLPGTIVAHYGAARRATIASKGAKEKMRTSAGGNPSLDYTVLSNEELRLLLCRRIAGMTFLPVTDETRQTIIAMLKITENDR
jgi:hypothetical protein